jgi:FtsH-binding integral membrane protein
MKYLYLFLTLAAIATAVWYIAFYEPSTPGATYQSTYAYISIGAAIIFGGLFMANFMNREQLKPNQLLDHQ